MIARTKIGQLPARDTKSFLATRAISTETSIDDFQHQNQSFNDSNADTKLRTTAADDVDEQLASVFSVLAMAVKHQNNAYECGPVPWPHQSTS